jgi:hypothetical protein
LLLSETFTLLLLSLFGISILTNATPFFGASYTLIATGGLVAAGFSLENFALIVLVTGAGATLAKLVLYSGALGFRKELVRNKNVRLFHDWLGRRSFYVALFVTAVIPAFPFDDFIYIGAGANRARIAPMIGVTFLAKFAKSAIEIYIEFKGLFGFFNYSRSSFGLSPLESTLILSALFVLLGVVLYKIDWEKLLRRAGVLKGTKPEATGGGASSLPHS